MSTRALLAAVLVALALPALAVGSDAVQNGRIVFVSDRSGSLELWTADAAGGTQTQLTLSAPGVSNQWPSWSPDGAQVAYVSAASGSRWFLSLVDADGTGAHQLFPSADGYQPFDDGPTAWSPDGQWILFSSTRPFNAAWNLWLVHPDGTELHRLTTDWGYDPAWSPDGTKIAFEGLDPAVGNVVEVMNADGSGPQRLTSATQPETAPAWSPDGTQIAFGRYTSDWRVSSAHAIFVANADGSNERQLTFGGTYDDHAIWSPDGQWILFGRGGQLYKVRPDGSSLTQLAMPGTDYAADWAAARILPPPPPPADTTPPTISIFTPTDGSSWALGTLVNVAYRCDDGRDGSGVASCTANQAGDRLDTGSVGWHDFTVTARDNAGNLATRTNRYDVVWPFSGFGSPVANPPSLNNVNPGSEIPLRFSLGGPRGSDVVDSVRWQTVSCDSFAATASPEPATATVAYAASLDRYTVQVATSKSWNGTCRRVSVSLRDGSAHDALFRFTK